MDDSVIIDPCVNIYYSSFYIHGLYDKFGKRNIHFKSTPFKDIDDRIDNFNFIVSRNGKETKYSIHLDDSYEIKESPYNWCDIYGSVNANFSETPSKYHSKLIALAPSFGIRLWEVHQTIFYCILNLLKIETKVDVRKFIGKYRRQFELRLPLNNYKYFNYNVKPEYIFHLSTLWQSDEWNRNDEGVNNVRANFIRICQSIDNVSFEGGLLFKKNSSVYLFRDVLFATRIPMNEYIKKTKQSILVFNTPAFWSCHGWKLGEYLALGKAIISTPLFNDLPVPLVHGKNIHYVENDEEDIRNAILFILNDVEYRHKLEKGARDYWEQYGTPLKSLELLGL